jgi:hypothetical protein
MKKIGLLLFISILSIQCSQKIASPTSQVKERAFTFKKITTLDKKYTESSGLEFYNNTIITHNDSGDLPRLYYLDLKGEEIGEVLYKNMEAIDWEDITKDDAHVYIADLGNNYGDRKDLTIYKIKSADLTDANASVYKITINYPDQTIYDRNEQKHPYDAESLVAIGDYLYVFSKDWKDLTTIVYQIDKSKAIQQAKTIATEKINGLITGATFNGKNRILLCGYSSTLDPFIIEVDYNNGEFFFHKKQFLPLDNGAQIEAITFIQTDKQGNEIYYLSSEAVNIKLEDNEAKSDAELYRLVLKNL